MTFMCWLLGHRNVEFVTEDALHTKGSLECWRCGRVALAWVRPKTGPGAV